MRRWRTSSWLDKAVDDYSVSHHIMVPTFDALRRDPRFGRVRARLGLAPR